MKNYTLLFLTLLQLICSPFAHAQDVKSTVPDDQVYYRFEAGLLPDKYNLLIINSSFETVTFQTDGEANTLTLDDGKVLPLTKASGLLDPATGAVVSVKPGGRASLAFNIPSDSWRRAKTLTFRGKTASGKEFTVLYDVPTTEITVKDGAVAL